MTDLEGYLSAKLELLQRERNDAIRALGEERLRSLRLEAEVERLTGLLQNYREEVTKTS